MGYAHRSKHWLRGLAWQLGALTACVISTKTDTIRGATDASGLEQHHCRPTGISTDLPEAALPPPQQCPVPSPCYRSATAEFCVFTADAGQDGTGTTRPVPVIVAEPERAVQIMRTVSDARRRPDPSGQIKYAVVPMPGRGLGAIASGRLERGEHILSDAPSLIIDHCMMAAVPQYHLGRLMNAAADRLTAAQRAQVVRLAVLGDKAPDAHYLVGRIYATSAYMLDSDGAFFGAGCGVGALFPAFARVNHDCRPNAAYHFDPDTAAMRVYAVRPIAAGEEITVSYINPFLRHANRQKLLRDRWGFKCSCAACSAPAGDVSRSDTRLERISSLWPRLLDNPVEEESAVVPEPHGQERETQLADLLVSLSTEERLDAVMLQPYRIAALEWNAVGESGKAVRYAELAVEYGTNTFGKGNRKVRDMEELMQDPEFHWSWGIRL